MAAGLAAAMSFAAVLGACRSESTPSPDQMPGRTAGTAPANLELLCVNSAAQSSGVDSSRVVPLASRRLDGNSWRVDLDVTGARVNCSVDDRGSVVTLDPG
jgi:hypothetical protein